MTVLVLAAHADDETLGAGGSVAKHLRDGDDVLIVVAADCRAARANVAPDLLPAFTEALAVLEQGGRSRVKQHFLGFPAMRLSSEELALNRLVEVIVRELEPDVVYTHHWNDLNSDHRAVFRAAMVAMRPSGKPQRLLCFEIPSSTEWTAGGDAFQPNYFVDVTESINHKLAAMSCYQEELRPAPHPRGIDALRTRAAYWGQVAGCPYAEAFVLAREIVR